MIIIVCQLIIVILKAKFDLFPSFVYEMGYLYIIIVYIMVLRRREYVFV